MFRKILSNVEKIVNKKVTVCKIYPVDNAYSSPNYDSILCRKCGTTIQYDPFEDFSLLECRLCSMY
jgi:hypothetical protein